MRFPLAARRWPERKVGDELTLDDFDIDRVADDLDDNRTRESEELDGDGVMRRRQTKQPLLRQLWRDLHLGRERHAKFARTLFELPVVGTGLFLFLDRLGFAELAAQTFVEPVERAAHQRLLASVVFLERFYRETWERAKGWLGQDRVVPQKPPAAAQLPSIELIPELVVDRRRHASSHRLHLLHRASVRAAAVRPGLAPKRTNIRFDLRVHRTLSGITERRDALSFADVIDDAAQRVVSRGLKGMRAVVAVIGQRVAASAHRHNQ